MPACVRALALALLVVGCEAPAAAGTSCVRDAQCGASLVCALGVCRAACRTSRDCEATARCLVEPSTGVSVCSIAEVDDCGTTGCPSGLACREGSCVNLCGDLVACPDGVCVDDVCAAIHGDAGVPIDAAMNDSGVDAGVDAGNAACHGPGCDPVVHLSIGGAVVFATTASGALWAWGNARFGVLGDGLETHGTCAACSATPVRALDAAGAPFTDVVEAHSGGAFSCARRRDGSVWCWGRDFSGQLGRGAVGDSLVPVRVMRAEGAGMVPVDDATALFTGVDSACLLRGSPSEAWCWGDGANGRLGTGNTAEAGIAMRAPELGTDLVTIEMAQTHSLSLSHDGTIRGVGGDTCSLIGSGTIDSDVLTSSPFVLAGARALALNTFAACAIDGTGELACWGENRSMYAGAGSPVACGTCPATCVRAPTRVARPVGHAFVRIFGHSGGSFFGLDAAGRLFAWNGAFGEPYGDVAFPTPVMPERRFAEAFTEAGACALTTDGDVLCWGADDVGQLGRGTVSATPDGTPTMVVWP